MKVFKGINFAGQASAPSSPANGDVYYDTTLNKLRCYENGIWVNLSDSDGSILLADGSVGSPSLAFINSPTTGLYRVSADSLGFSAAGVNVGQYSSAGAWTLGGASGTQTHTVNGSLSIVGSSNIFTAQQGSATNPSITFSGDTDTGLYRLGTNAIGFAVNGTQAAFVSAGGTGLVTAGNTSTSLLSGVTQAALFADNLTGSNATTAASGIITRFRSADVSFTTDLGSALNIFSAIKGASHTLTRYSDIFINLSTPGTNNAAIADNTSFTGNWLLNFSSTRASSFGGPIQLPAGSISAPSLRVGLSTQGLYQVSSTSVGLTSPGASGNYALQVDGGAATSGYNARFTFNNTNVLLDTNSGVRGLAFGVNGTTYASVSTAGAWTFGVTDNTLSHTLNGSWSATRLATASTGATAYTGTLNLNTDTVITTGSTVSAIFGIFRREITNTTTDTGGNTNLSGVSALVQLTVPTGQTYTHSGRGISGIAVMPINSASYSAGVAPDGTLAISTYAQIRTASDAIATGTRKIGLSLGTPSGATNNAFITDNTTFTGDWFINSTSTNSSRLSGALGIGADPLTNVHFYGFTAGTGLVLRNSSGVEETTAAYYLRGPVATSTSDNVATRLHITATTETSNILNYPTGVLSFSRRTASQSFSNYTSGVRGYVSSTSGVQFNGLQFFTSGDASGGINKTKMQIDHYGFTRIGDPAGSETRAALVVHTAGVTGGQQNFASADKGFLIGNQSNTGGSQTWSHSDLGTAIARSDVSSVTPARDTGSNAMYQFQTFLWDGATSTAVVNRPLFTWLNFSTIMGSLSAAGAWTLGAAAGTQTHVINGSSSQTRFQALARFDVASAATIAALNSTRSFVKLTGSTATTIQGIAAGVDGQRLTVVNLTGQNMTVSHENGSATAADRITTMTGADVVTTANGAAEFVYDTGSSRWICLYVTF